MSEYKLVYDLRGYLNHHPKLIHDTQVVTLDSSTIMGLKGEYGLYGTDEWWDSIEKGLIETEAFEGIIYRIAINTEYSLLDNHDNMVGVRFDDDTADGYLDYDGLSHVSALFTDSQSVESFQHLYRVGNKIKATFILDKLKDPENWLGPRRKKGVIYLPWQIFLTE